MSIQPIRALLLDMDGVMWRDDEPIGDVPVLLGAIQARGLDYAFVTNNATRTVEQYQEKFRGFSAEVPAERIHTSSRVTAKVLSKRYPDGGKVFIIGERGLQEALAERGFEQAEEDCLAVVVGLDRELTYAKLRTAALLIQGGAAFVGTNPDKSLPSPAGEVPGAGSILAALQAATGAEPAVIGKPQPALLQAALEQLGVQAEHALMVGDRAETDILAGQNAGCRTALVLSGITSRAEAEAWQPPPDYIAADLTSLLDLLP
ncbi:MAG: HAD-IIA family hydrolase [Anaerolineales bacterium]|nr:HAD-IIA family hydrolase [Anaerolineales bacterium]